MSFDPRAALQDAAPSVFWLDTPLRPQPRAALEKAVDTDLAVVGGGYTGLWTAVLAKERDPSRDVLLVEGHRVGWAASGRNGGFCASDLTHGEANGRSRFPAEYQTIERLGCDNLDGIEATLTRYGIECDFRRSGELSVATEQYQLASLAEDGGEVLDREGVRSQLDSPTYLGGVWTRDRTALVDPARLAWGLASVAESLGVRVAEHTEVRRIRRVGAAMQLDLDGGASVRARRVALGTNAFPTLLRRTRLHTVPVYDYVLVTEPLSEGQLACIGWHNRQGVSDRANQFHYYRLTADNRILWGGYDAVYHYGRALRASYDDRPATFEMLAAQFFGTFPQLEGLRFTHRWGGAIDTCSRFFAFYGTAFSGRAAYALGYTGLGVGASRFAAQVVLDLLDGLVTPRTQLKMVRRRPLPFPPEPLAYLAIEATRRSLVRADENAGQRNVWLRTLDRLGLGFDS